jgi:alkanesulfonate monooxygenase SsuD/methylene tetrahydromethanopterin reductase-like flavin-dependent oxidoreductase (luciferase family)
MSSIRSGDHRFSEAWLSPWETSVGPTRPWTNQGQSGHAWSWLGSALEATSLSFGIVTAPGQRYHSAVIAQAIATLALMYPGGFWAVLGSGEALNEHVTGSRWPRKEVREARLLESVDVIRRLLDGE